MYNMNNSIDGIDFSRYSSSTYPSFSINGTVDVQSDGIDFSRQSSSTIYPDSSTDGTVGVWPDRIPVQIVETNPNDVIMCQISDDIDMDEYKILYQELKKVFPNNNILLVNSNIVKNITIFKPKEEIEAPFLEKDTCLNTKERQFSLNDFLY